MNTKNVLFVAAILMSLVFGFTVYAQKQNGSKVTWEYHVWSFNTWQEATARLSADGNEGWELVTVTETPPSYFNGVARSESVTIYLKRAK